MVWSSVSTNAIIIQWSQPHQACTNLCEHEASQLAQFLGLFQPTTLLVVAQGKHRTTEEVVVHLNGQTVGSCWDLIFFGENENDKK